MVVNLHTRLSDFMKFFPLIITVTQFPLHAALLVLSGILGAAPISSEQSLPVKPTEHTHTPETENMFTCICNKYQNIFSII